MSEFEVSEELKSKLQDVNISIEDLKSYIPERVTKGLKDDEIIENINNVNANKDITPFAKVVKSIYRQKEKEAKRKYERKYWIRERLLSLFPFLRKFNHKEKRVRRSVLKRYLSKRTERLTRILAELGEKENELKQGDTINNTLEAEIAQLRKYLSEMRQYNKNIRKSLRVWDDEKVKNPSEHNTDLTDLLNEKIKPSEYDTSSEKMVFLQKK